MSAAALELLHLAESWRLKAARVRLKYADHALAAEPACVTLETCAEELEALATPKPQPSQPQTVSNPS